MVQAVTRSISDLLQQGRGLRTGFVVETKEQLFLCEPKRADQLQNPEVVAKKTAAIEWCKHATDHARQHGGKQWNYLLIPHDAITGNMTLEGLASRYQV